MKRILLLLALLAAPAAHAEDYVSSGPRVEAVEKDWGQWLGPWRAKVTAKMLEDFAEQYRYADQNAALPAPQTGEQRVVFIGDSITDRWQLSRFFPGRPYVNRGIGGQVTPQMVVRFQADVVALKPAAVVILGGINDIHGVLQVETDAQVEANYKAMADMAVANDIRPVFALITPVNNYTPNAASMLQDRPQDRVARLNAWLRDFCAAHGYGLIDYGPLLRDDTGLLKAEYTTDGIHPNDTAYAIMAPVAEAAIEAALRK